MKKYMIYLNSRRCIACHSCEVHCKVNKNLPTGPFLCEISATPMTLVGGVPRMEFVFSTCHHCDDPLCLHACKVEALTRRDDGIVYIDEEKCIGCMACRKNCPWDIPVKNSDTGKAVKCDLCMDRLDEGSRPACVSKCPTHALELVEIFPL